MNNIYAENILDHFRHPRNTGILHDFTVTHEEKNLACGDAIELSMRIEDSKVVDIAWNGTGCAISQASMSILSEELIGKSEDDILNLTTEHIYAMLGVPIGPRRFKCALMSLHTVKNAICKHKDMPIQEWTALISTHSLNP